MAIIQWDASYSVNIDRIDRQHQKLITLINQLHDAMIANKAQAVMVRIVEDMVDYTQTHFSAEELYMEEFGYPELIAHRREHQLFIDKARDLRTRVQSSELIFSLEVIRFLRDWLTHHILETDMKYASFFAEKGIS